MNEPTLKQISAMGPVNTLKLCRNTCVFYRMKEKAEKALEKNDVTKADRYLLRKIVAAEGIRRASEKIAAKTCVCRAEEIESKVTGLGEYCHPSFGFEAAAGTASLIIGAIGILAGAEIALKLGVMGLIVTSMIYVQSLADFANTVYAVLTEKMRNAAKGGLGKAEAAQ